MTEPTSIASSAKRVSDVAALNLIDIRRIDRAAGKSAKRGDLTDKLKRRRPNSIAPPSSAPATVAPEAQEATPAAAPKIAPVPSLPPLAAFAPTAALPPVVRRAIALPEPYIVPSRDLTPSYIVAGPAAMLQPNPTSPPPPAALNSTPLPYDDLRSADDLVYYWDELRGASDLPLISSLDRTCIAISWPDTLMVSFDADHAGMPQITRLSRFTGRVAVTSMVTDWILSCSSQVARRRKAMETERDFTDEQNTRRYYMLLLPFVSAMGTSDHVLCHLNCVN